MQSQIKTLAYNFGKLEKNGFPVLWELPKSPNASYLESPSVPCSLSLQPNWLLLCQKPSSVDIFSIKEKAHG